MYLTRDLHRRNAGRGVRRPDCTLATVDHNVPYVNPFAADMRVCTTHGQMNSTTSRKNFASVKTFIEEPDSRGQCMALEDNVKEFGLTYFGMNDRRQGKLSMLSRLANSTHRSLAGIVHIIGPEQGFTVRSLPSLRSPSDTNTSSRELPAYAEIHTPPVSWPSLLATRFCGLMSSQHTEPSEQSLSESGPLR